MTFDGSLSTDDRPGSDPGTVVSYRWRFDKPTVSPPATCANPGTTQTGPVITHAFPSAGVWKATLVAFDNSGQCDIKTLNVVVTPAPPQAFFLTSLNPTAGTTTFFDARSSTDADGTVVAYEWNFGDGSSATGAQTGHKFAAGGTFPVTLTVTDNEGRKSSRTTNLTVAPAPAVSKVGLSPKRPRASRARRAKLSFRQRSAAPVTVRIDKLVTGRRSGKRCVKTTRRNRGRKHCTRAVKVASKQLAGKAGKNSTTLGKIAGRKKLRAGRYRITLKTSAGSRRLDIRIVAGARSSVLTSPIARWTCAAPGLHCDPCTVHCTSPTGQVAAGVAVAFDGRPSSDDRPGAPAGSVTSWAWRFGDGATAAGAQVSHAFAHAGTYSVVLRVTDNDGEIDEKALNVVVGSGTTTPRPSSGYAARVLATPGLLSYWRLGETAGTVAADSKGTRKGTYAGGVALGGAGALSDGSKAATFDGVNDQVTLPALPTAANFTIEGWQRISAASPANDTLFGSSATVRLVPRPAGYYADVVVGGTRAVLQGAGPSNVGAWVHWVLVRASTKLTLYRNGVAVATRTGLPATASGLSGNIGRASTAFPAKGGIDEVAVYSSALSAADVQAHFSSR